MKNFIKFAAVDTVPLLLAVHQNPDLWTKNTIRQDFPESPHVDTESIILRFQDMKEDFDPDDVQCNNTPEYSKLPEARELVMGLMARVKGEQLGRVLITRLPHGGVIKPHEDQGASATFYQRYHIVLQAHMGNMFTCEDETVQMQTGEVWWFANEKTHSVRNDSGNDRVHLIVDIRS